MSKLSSFIKKVPVYADKAATGITKVQTTLSALSQLVAIAAAVAATVPSLLQSFKPQTLSENTANDSLEPVALKATGAAAVDSETIGADEASTDYTGSISQPALAGVSRVAPVTIHNNGGHVTVMPPAQ